MLKYRKFVPVLHSVPVSPLADQGGWAQFYELVSRLGAGQRRAITLTFFIYGVTATPAQAQTYRCTYENHQNLMDAALVAKPLGIIKTLANWWGAPRDEHSLAHRKHQMLNKQWQGRVLFVVLSKDGKAGTISGDWFGTGTSDFEVRQTGGGGNSWVLQRQWHGAASSPISTIQIRDWGEDTPKDDNAFPVYRFVYTMNADALTGSCSKY